ncbi:MAG: BACON domain-containing protein [Prevotellaceae bacterium]|nr:BACON domain-containing protein [Prevotellaceae bacterium]
MKIKVFLFYCIAVCLVLCTACKDDKGASDPSSLSIDQTTIDVLPEGGKTLVGVSTDLSWTATADADWVRLSPASGNTSAIVAVDINGHLGHHRKANITFTSGAITKTVEISQRGQASVLEFSRDVKQWIEGDIMSREGVPEVALNVTSNMDWTATSNVDWITISTTSATNGNVLRSNAFAFSVGVNTDLLLRKGTIFLTSGNYKDSLVIQQMGNRIVNSNGFVEINSFPYREGGRYTALAVEWGALGERELAAPNWWNVEYGTLGYQIPVTSAGRLKLVDKVTQPGTDNIWFLLYDDIGKVGNYYNNAFLLSADGTFEYDVEAGKTYYILGLVNYWYWNPPDPVMSTLNYDIEITLN